MPAELPADCLQQSRLVDPAACLSLGQVNSITRESLFTLAEPYPEAKAMLHKAMLHMTVKAALVFYYREFVKKK